MSLFYNLEEVEYFIVVVTWFMVKNLEEIKVMAIKCGLVTLFIKKTLIKPLPAEGIIDFKAT